MDYNPFSLENKTILITGASSGIGRGIAVACSKMGAAVVLNGRNEQSLISTSSKMEGDGHSIIVGDLTNSDSLCAIVQALPKLDGIVHCAGIGSRVLCKNIVEQDFDNTIGTNLKAPVMLQTEILKQKRINKCASIVFIQ